MTNFLRSPNAARSAGGISLASLMSLSTRVHRNDSIHRTFAMNSGLTAALPDAESLADLTAEKRRQRIIDMTAALRTLFGDAALPIADGQPRAFDVGGMSGIRWQDLADELRAAKLPRMVTILPTP